MAMRRQLREKLSRRGGIVYCAIIYGILFLPIAVGWALLSAWLGRRQSRLAEARAAAPDGS